ncbi:hypothetical protein MU1_01820 [Paenibacillus glycanilyticus]|uniref:Uncharacterized protein n=1 Tax=Paenibacillus glycanilyticus TaxID=126569 RepID=A0ABQ6G9B6_9BACL|nr:hypothetical protein MU1_01820 [Paenibacillus glycanilyticus]
MPQNKFTGYRVMFNVGSRFMVHVYMKEEYYEQWRLTRDQRIKDVVIEEVEVELDYFLG